MIDQIERLLRPLWRRIQLMVLRGIVTAVPAEGELQRLQVSVLADEVQEALERVGNYGFQSVPQAGAEVLVVFPGGDRSLGLVIGVEDRRYRLKGMVKGEVAAYTDEGDYLWFKRGRELHARADKFKFQGATDELMLQISTLAGDVKSLADAVQALATAVSSGVGDISTVTGTLVGSGLFSVPDAAALTAAGTAATTAATSATTAGTAAAAAGTAANTVKGKVEGLTA